MTQKTVNKNIQKVGCIEIVTIRGETKWVFSLKLRGKVILRLTNIQNGSFISLRGKVIRPQRPFRID